MRLNEPTNRANTNIVNTLLGEEKRYGGSKSSLDYKAKEDGVLSTAANKKKNQKSQSDDQQQEAERKNSNRSGFPTRTREQTGIPPRRYGLSDLAKMTEEELMTALREDPEFAAEVQEYSAQLEQKEKEEKAAEAEQKDRRSKPSSPPVAERRKARLAQSSKSEPTANPTIRSGHEEYPDHIRELVDRGVPVTQWIVLLILVGAGLYYLMGPELKEGLKYIMKQTGKTKKRAQPKGKSKPKSKHQSHKGKKKMEQPRKPAIVKQTPVKSEASKPETSEPESPKTSSIQQEAPKESLPEPAASMPQKSKKKKNKNKRKKADAKESPDMASTDDGSTLHSDAEETPVVSPPPADLNMMQMETDNADDGEWETVTKSRKPVVKAPLSTPVAPTEEVPEIKTETAKKPVTTSKPTVETTPQSSIDIQKEIEAAEALSTPKESANDGWETVTKSRKPKASTPPTQPAPVTVTSESSSKQTAKTDDKKKPETKVVPEKKAKKKTTKNKKEQPVESSKSEKATDAATTDGDAALALKLQMEEEKLAKQQAAGQAEEQWEEVKKNKNKKGQKATSS